MKETVIQINENTWRIEEEMVRVYLLAGRDKALLVDTGMTMQGLRAIAEELCGLPVELLNTHADPDHIGCNKEFDHMYMHPDEEPNYRIFGGQGTVIPLSEGDEIDLGGRVLTVIAMPGHTPGSIGLLDAANRVLISGDSVQLGGVVMTGPGRDLTRYVESMKSLEAKWLDKFDTVYPAHGHFPVEASQVTALRDCAEQVLAGQLEGEETLLFGRIPALHYHCPTGGGFFLPAPNKA